MTEPDTEPGDTTAPGPPPPVELYGYLVTQGTIGNVHALTGRAVTSHDEGRTWA